MTKQKTNLSVSKRREELRRKQEAKRKQTMIGTGIAMGVIVVGFVLWLAFGRTSGSEPVVLEGERPLAALEPSARNDYYSAYPPMVIDLDKTYEAVITVADKGEMRLDLFAEAAPLTVNNFVFLANQGFYDGLTFHRVMDNFMAQGGDPAGIGTGGPGYEFADETDTGFTFDRRGLLAMANAGPATNGSQFFITFAPTPHLDGLHTIFGELTAGDDVLSSLAITDSGAPADVIEKIVIVER
jgi:cyclophilin family peptidyl-prolyl cis-trans isomerase